MSEVCVAELSIIDRSEELIIVYFVCSGHAHCAFLYSGAVYGSIGTNGFYGTLEQLDQLSCHESNVQVSCLLFTKSEVL